MKNKIIVIVKNIKEIISHMMRHPIASFTFIGEMSSYLSQSGLSLFDRRHFRIKPFLTDRTEKLHIEPHYTYHTAWAARRLHEMSPNKHVDISSHRFFATLVSAFVPMDYYEYRPAELYLSGLKSMQADILKLPFPSNSVESLSCMHVVEHLGLGRYGDPIDPDADKKAAGELQRVLANNGNLLFVVPVGESYQVQFNGQRIYKYDDVISMFPDLSLKEFSLIPDDWQLTKGMVINASPDMVSRQEYGCGCFIFTKK